MSTMANEDADWNSPVQDWFNEHKMFTYSEKYVFDKGTGHYTQVSMWTQ